MKLEKYSFGIGDRFGKEAEAQLAAIQEINKAGIDVVPVWNKSYREHSIIQTDQSSVFNKAVEAVKKSEWSKNFYVDADHIGLSVINKFIEHSNFFTIDVAHFIGQPVSEEVKNQFIEENTKYLGQLSIPGINKKNNIDKQFLIAFADNYLSAIFEVKKIYDYLIKNKGKDRFIPEVSMDECEKAQSPLELFFILSELKKLGVELQTIAPKFTGLFPKGVDYVGDIDKFEQEFEEDVAVLKYAAEKLGLPNNLKLSVHSGSDKFSIYPAIKKTIRKFNVGIHVKTAGTTWLEEVIGLAQGGGEGLKIAKKIYENSLSRYDELTSPYLSVLDIDKSILPDVNTVNSWTSKQFADALIHDLNCKSYNRSFRQLIHVGYKIAVELGDEFKKALERYHEKIAANVKYNIYERHLKLLFLD